MDVQRRDAAEQLIREALEQVMETFAFLRVGPWPLKQSPGFCLRSSWHSSDGPFSDQCSKRKGVYAEPENSMPVLSCRRSWAWHRGSLPTLAMVVVQVVPRFANNHVLGGAEGWSIGLVVLLESSHSSTKVHDKFNLLLDQCIGCRTTLVQQKMFLQIWEYQHLQ